jgi:hypothetical protein
VPTGWPRVLLQQAIVLLSWANAPPAVDFTRAVRMQRADDLRHPLAERVSPWQVPLSCLVPKHVSAWTFAEASLLRDYENVGESDRKRSR